MPEPSRPEGISARGWANVAEVMPRIRAAVADREKQHQAAKRKRVEQEDTETETEPETEEQPPAKRARPSSQQQEEKCPDSSASSEVEVEVEAEVETEITPIDLSTSENWLVRDEMLALCRDGIAKNLKPRHFSYPGSLAGDPDLLSALAGFFNAYFRPHKPVEEHQLAVAPGAAGCLDALIYNICDPGDGVLIPAPCWNAFDTILRSRTGISILPVVVPTAGVGADALDVALTAALVDELEVCLAKAQCKVKALLITNPNNPLGRRYPRTVLEACVRFCEKHDLQLVSDEIYALTAYEADDLGEEEAEPFVSALSLDLAAQGCDPSRVHVVWSTSKDLGQNGLRMGCLVSQSNTTVRTGAALWATVTVSSLTAVAVTHVLRSPRLKSLLQTSSERLAKAYRELTTLFRKYEIPYVPANAGLYVFARIAPDARTWEDEREAVDGLKRAGVLVSAGRGYHVPEDAKGWARVGFAVPEDEFAKAAARMEAFFLRQRETREITERSEEDLKGIKETKEVNSQ